MLKNWLAQTQYSINRPHLSRNRVKNRNWSVQIVSESLETRVLLSNYAVTNTNDSGAGSLRAAILNANSSADAANIVFSIATSDPGFVDVDSTIVGGDAGKDVFRIQPLTALPAVNNVNGKSITINGGSQVAATGESNAFGPEIEIDGSQVRVASNGLTVDSTEVQIASLAIHSFDGRGIHVRANNVTIADNYIGTDAIGILAAPNSNHGIEVYKSSSIIISDVDIRGNLVSGNDGHGISLAYVDGGVITGNKIGTTADGQAALGNGTSTFNADGINLGSSSNILIGGPDVGDGNLVSGNEGAGVFLQYSSNSLVTVQGNTIGTDIDGEVSLGRQETGLRADQGVGVTVIDNLLSGNSSRGIGGKLSDSNISGNRIGVNAAGNAAVPNGSDGFQIKGGSNLSIQSNLISGNARYGILIEDSENASFMGNLVGTNFDGTLDIGNGSGGAAIWTSSDITIGAGNIFSGNANEGLWLSGVTNATVTGSKFGTNAAGTAAISNDNDGIHVDFGSTNVTIGGATVAERNLLSGNGGQGIEFREAATHNNFVFGNYIGTNAAGTAAIPNNDGIEIEGASGTIIGGGAAGRGNLISGNLGDGVNIFGSTATGNRILGNLIGTDVTGMLDLGNQSDGVQINGTSGNSVGGSNPGEGNVISGNDSDGLDIFNGATHLEIQGNRIGVSRNSNVAIGNAGNGIWISDGANNVSIGGVNSGEGNVVAFNRLNGVLVSDAGSSARIRGNSIYGNAGLTIKLGNGQAPNDVNDVDTGPNGLQNYPTLRLGTVAGETVISGRLQSMQNAIFDIDLYSDDTSSRFETAPRAYWKTVSVTTNGEGLGIFSVPVFGVGSGRFIMATATNSLGETSEFTPTALDLRPQTYVGDLAEANAEEWTTFSLGEFVHGVTDSTEHVTFGSNSIRFDTTAAFDTGVQFPAAADAGWNFNELTTFSFQTFSDNPNSNGFQYAQPIVVFHAVGGNIRYTPNTNLTPRQGSASYQIPLSGDSTWSREMIGDPDLTQVYQFEIHQDTWDTGFTLWYDNVWLYEEALEISSGGNSFSVGETISLGARAPGGTQTRTVSIKNVSSSPIVFQPSTVSGAFEITQNFSVNQSLAPGEVVDLQVSANSDVAGTFLSKIQLVSDLPPSPHLTLPVGASFIDGLRLLKDLHPGLANSQPAYMRELQGVVYFIADDGVHGNELWRTDGTSGGTYLVKDINSGIDGSEIGELAILGDQLIFVAYDGDHGSEIWTSDGTANGTNMVVDIVPGENGSVLLYSGFDNPSSAQDSEGFIYFAAEEDGDDFDLELWRTDGTAAGTTKVVEVNPDGRSFPRGFTEINGTTYFSAVREISRQLWKTDGTVGGTVPIIDPWPEDLSVRGGGFSSMTSLRDYLLLSMDDSVHGEELWISDGTATGTMLVQDINPGFGNARLLFLATLGNEMIFAADNGSQGRELWATDGTAGGTRLIVDINAGAADGLFSSVSERFGSEIYFFADCGSNGRELWKTDGTAGGTRQVFDLNPGLPGAVTDMRGMSRLGNKLIFGGNDGTTGEELWIYEPFGPSTLTLALSAASIGEWGSVTATVTRTGLTDRPLVVNLFGSDPGEMQVPVNVTIPAGQASVQVTLPAVRDFVIDGTKTVSISATATGFETAAAQVDITDIDTAQVSLRAVSHGSEANLTDGKFEVRISGTAEFDIDVPYTWNGTAQSGIDYTALSGTVKILAGSSTTMIPVIVLNDDFAEYTETLRLTLGTPTVAGLTVNPAAKSAQILILDNDVAGIAVTNRAVTVSETGTTANIGVKLTSRPEVSVRVLIGFSDSTEATAFGPGNSTFLTFTSANWDVEQAVTIRGIDDALTDGSQRSTITLRVDTSTAPPPLYRSVAPVPIDVTTTDDEPAAPLATVDSVVTFNRDAAAEQNLSPQKNGQRSIIRQIEVALNGDVAVSIGNVTNGSFVLTNTGTNVNVGLSVASRVFSGGKTRIVLMFTSGIEASGSLIDGYYLFLINGGVLGIDANRSGSVGGTHSTSFHRLFGDSDGDRDVDGQDFGRYRLATMATPARPSVYSSVFDYDNDGGILRDLDDYYALFARLGSHL